MAQQKWKTDPTLHSAKTEQKGLQTKKLLDYDTVYVKEFLDSDPLRDWESIERAKWLWEWAMDMLVTVGSDHNINSEWAVLDVGTKDAQFPEWLRDQGIMGMGIEYSEPYVRYAINKGRPSMYGNACCMEFEDNTWDFTFAHHLHGLLPDYMQGLQEMFRVSKRYMLALNQVPGNPRKHFSYIDSPQIYHDFVESVECKVIHNDYLETGYGDEWVIFLEKILPEDAETAEPILEEEPVEENHKKKKFGKFF